MRIVMFYHSLISDWNHGNAHFLRGVASELIARGHVVSVLEPQNSWSVENLVRDQGRTPLEDFSIMYPQLTSQQYLLEELDLDCVLENVDLVLVHEWSDPELVRRVGEHRARSRRYLLLFHDTHHRMLTQSDEMQRYDLRHYQGVLAFGQVISALYLARGLTERAWTWHEAADIRVFNPAGSTAVCSGTTPLDLVWIGNWGDGERTEELQEFLIGPVVELGLRAEIYGVRYPEKALNKLKESQIPYRGWISNFKVPQVFAQARLTVHIPRRPYMQLLPGIPTIRVFEALACGIPLISAPWNDVEQLFTLGEDFLIARDGHEMRQQINRVLSDPDLAKELSMHGYKTILERHTCAHRVDELLAIFEDLQNAQQGE